MIVPIKNTLKTLAFSSLFALTSLSIQTIAMANTEQTSQQVLTTQVFSVEKMTCKMCHITIRKAIEKLNGVTQAKVDYQTKTATVTYDASKTNATQIALASTNAGYPAKIKNID
jgi:mercuric ion binding protein